MLLPVLAHVYGGRSTVIILTITQAVGNGSRAWYGREEID